MDPIEKNKLQRAISEKHKQMEIPIELIKIQETYNKRNVERQHEFNLEIFKKQKRLTIITTIITAICSFVTGIGGVLIGYYLSTTQKQPKMEIQPKISITQPQNTSEDQRVQGHPETKTKQSAQGVSSSNTSKGSLKKP